METKRYKLLQDVKDWRIVDTTTGLSVASFHSRRGFPATSLKSRAINTLAEFNRNAQDPALVLIGSSWHRREWLPKDHPEYRATS